MSTLRAMSSRTLAAMMLLLAARRATAQCPNGRPPPCQAGAPAAARKDPVLNPRTWIVVPFTNTTKAQDVDWLRDASVNLLSMDLGRWTDINVVPDKRVADLVRDLPTAKRAEPLTLSEGIAIAKRAGAGMLVMGDFIKTGSTVRIAATLFDVRNGSRVRSLTQTPGVDSLLTAFGPLARGVLDVPPPPDAKVSDVGTNSLAAYQAYLLGTKALFKYDLNGARVQLLRALSIDSTFALAHLQYSLLLWWAEAPGSQIEGRNHALAAKRFGRALPERDQLLIDARIASASDDFTKACEISRKLVERDSTDIQALYSLGECSFHDSTVDPIPGDSINGKFRNTWNTSMRAMEKILELDPSYFGAFEHIFDILQAVQHGGRTCPTPGAGPRNDCVRYVSVVLRSGDSLEINPVRYGADRNRAFFAQLDRAAKDKARLRNLELAQQVAQRWLNADKSSEIARLAMARVYLARGNVAAADSAIGSLAPPATAESFLTYRLRMEIAAKRGRGTEARAMFDSLVKAVPDNPSIEGGRGAMELMFGRMTRFDHGGAVVAGRIGPEAVAYQREIALMEMGQPRPELARAESTFYAALAANPACNLDCRFSPIRPSLIFSTHVTLIPRSALDSAAGSDSRLRLSEGIATRDTAMLRKAALNLESGAHENVSNSQSEFGWSVTAALAYLQLRDTASAMRITRYFVDTAMAFMPANGGASDGLVGSSPVLWVRAMLMRADLAKATGNKAEARIWYLRVLDLWADADPELKPTIDRIRAALTALDTKA